jgi:hypothetical protein
MNPTSPTIVMATLTMFTRIISFRGAHTGLLGLPHRSPPFKCDISIYGWNAAAYKHSESWSTVNGH